MSFVMSRSFMYKENRQEQEHDDLEAQKKYAPSQEQTHQHQSSTESEDARVHNADGSATLNDSYERSQKNKNERFIIFALIAGVVIVSVLVGAAMLFFYPAQNAVTTADATEPRGDEESVNETETSDNGEVIIIYGGDEETAETKSTESVTSDTNASSDSFEKSVSKETTSVSKPSRAPSRRESTKPIENISTPIPPVARAKSTPNSVQVPQTPTPKNNSQVIKPSISPITKKPIPTAVNNKKGRQRLYWVQVFSTGNRNKAYSIKSEFEKRGITMLVVTKTINNKLYYRLRIGPYYNKSEGNKFLQWVRKIDVYKDAYLAINYI